MGYAMKRTYLVTSPIKCGGKRYSVGSTIDLENGEAAKLREAIGDEVASQGGQEPTDSAERIAAIVAAIGQLDAGDTSLWMNSGAPKTIAIEAVTGWQLTAKERDAAWAQISAAQ